MKKQHPVLSHDIDPANLREYEQSLSECMAMDESQWTAFIPRHGVATYCECPKCHGGIQQEQRFTWRIDSPDSMTCKYCGSVFPDSNFPETELLSGTNAAGEQIEFPFHRDQTTGFPVFLSTHLLMLKRNWSMKQAQTLGKAYVLTGNEDYAMRVVILLDAAAKAYPHYPVLRNNPTYFKFADSQEPPFPWDGGRWKYVGGEFPETLVRAYDMVYDSKAFDALSETRGYNVRMTVEKDFFRATFEAENTRDTHVTNWCAYLGHAAEMGRVIGEPEYLHWALHWISENIYGGFFFDGFWRESPSYHAMTMGGLKSAMEALRGYSDPPGYTNPKTGNRLDNCIPEKLFSVWDKMLKAPAQVSLPDGSPVSFHDAWGRKESAGVNPIERSRSVMMPGIGHAILGRGKGSDQTQAHLHFSGEYGHAHFDSLNLILCAKDREMISDLGYTWSCLRQWTRSAPAHNTVVVNRMDHAKRPNVTDGDLLNYFPDNNGVSMVEADCRRAYCHLPGIEVYRRMLVMIPLSDRDAYVLDVFTVRGGETHDWMLHGDADRDMNAACSIDLPGKLDTMLEPGDEFEKPLTEYAVTNWYGMIRDLATGTPGTSHRVAVAFTYPDEPDRGIQTTILSNPNDSIFLGRSPSARRLGRHTDPDDRKAYDYWTPHLCVRRTGPENTFVAIHEPFAGTPSIHEVSSVLSGPGEAFMFTISHGQCTDHVFVGHANGSPVGFPDGTSFNGRVGITRTRDTKTQNMWMFDACDFRHNGSRISAEPATTGVITGSERKADGADTDALFTSATVPDDLGTTGRWIVVTHGNGFTHGYHVTGIERKGNITKLVLDHDHGLRVDGEITREVFFPRRNIEGENTFRIARCASL